jgi:hypothetical protein
MTWVYLVGLTVVLWGACGAVIGIGRKLWPLDTVLRIHLIAAPVIAFLLAAVHAWLAPDFNPVLRAAVMTVLVIVLDAVVVAPLFERSYDMFRTAIGTWIPFVLIFIASWAAGTILSGWGGH